MHSFYVTVTNESTYIIREKLDTDIIANFFLTQRSWVKNWLVFKNQHFLYLISGLIAMEIKKYNKIEGLIEKVCTQQGVALYNLKIVNTPSGKRIVVFITKEGGVTIGDCSRISRIISDELDFFAHKYFLEVSSPGLERQLENFEHFKGAIGEIVKIIYLDKEGIKKITQGALKQVDIEKVMIERREGINVFTQEIYFSDIKKARTVFLSV